MADLGQWNVNISIGGMPQKIATAVGELNEMVGAEYAPIAYLGSQLVNGTNHAVLAEQTIVAGKDTKNIVVVIFHETKEGVTLANIERVIEGGEELGGINIDVKTDITEEDKDAFFEAFAGFLGYKVEPCAILATQVTKGTDTIYLATATPVIPDAIATAAAISVNALTKRVVIRDLLANKNDTGKLGYAFTW